MNPNSTTNNSAAAAQQQADDYRALQEARKQTQAEHEKELAQLERAYHEESSAQRDRFETQVQAQKLENYDNLRNIKRQVQNEEQKMRTAGKDRIQKVGNELYKESLGKEKEYTEKLKRVEGERAIALQQAQMKNAEESEYLKRVASSQTQSLFDETNKQVENVRKQKADELELQKNSAALANKEVAEKFETGRLTVQQKYDQELLGIQNRAINSLTNTRIEHATKLDAYANRQNDPFYRLVSANSNITDIGDSLEIRIRVPEHERGNIRVQLSNKDILISGVRSNNEQVETEPGRWVSTTSHQTYSEKLNLPANVDAKSLRIVHDDSGDVVYHLDKFDPAKKAPVFKADAVAMDRAQIPTPNYPSNLILPSSIPSKNNAKPIS